MREIVSWGLELAGIGCVAVGLVVVGAAVAGAVGAGVALLPVGGALVWLGNRGGGA
ncbi:MULTISPECIES: hypothetical protein [Streptomyces]|uniref:hypothetical protein n=1 Tax=Streptomyces TaxID=1883 RepID=UPI00186ADD47|nr:MULTISPECIES: hypothetical protein [Streptomyces]